MKRIALEDLLKQSCGRSYEEQYQEILGRMENGEIKPVEASGTNGKKPALYRKYWILEPQRDYSELIEELEYRLVPAISIDYYRNNVETYAQDRVWVLMLNDFWKNGKKSLKVPVSMNERSFEIWHREKFLQKGPGKKILKRCGLTTEDLNYYETSEPLAYYVHTRNTPQNLLIIENKDTFYSIRRAMIAGRSRILGIEIGTLIYGAGKGILRSFQDFMFCVEPHMREKDNTILYFGDLDYEGIGIFERLAEGFERAQVSSVQQGSRELEIRPFLEAYEAMLYKADAIPSLPESSDLQNRNISTRFFSYFTSRQVERMLNILESGRFLPQEMLSFHE